MLEIHSVLIEISTAKASIILKSVLSRFHYSVAFATIMGSVLLNSQIYYVLHLLLFLLFTMP